MSGFDVKKLFQLATVLFGRFHRPVVAQEGNHWPVVAARSHVGLNQQLFLQHKRNWSKPQETRVATKHMEASKPLLSRHVQHLHRLAEAICLPIMGWSASEGARLEDSRCPISNPAHDKYAPLDGWNIHF